MDRHIIEIPKNPVTEETLMRLAHAGISRRLRDSGLTYSLTDAIRLEQFSDVDRYAIIWVNSGGNALAVETALLLAGRGLLPTSLPHAEYGCRILIQW